jgi:hypothetical protein
VEVKLDLVFFLLKSTSRIVFMLGVRYVVDDAVRRLGTVCYSFR